MRLMMTLIAESPSAADMQTDIDEISTYLARQGVNVLGSERLADEGATISEHGDSPAARTNDISPLRAIWIVDVPSRAAAVEI
ncbi:MAG TPA: hypothetical protein VGF45_24625, partial [Polyangia bacterium]